MAPVPEEKSPVEGAEEPPNSQEVIDEEEEVI